MKYMWDMSGPDRLLYMRQLALVAEAQLLAKDRASHTARRRRRRQALEATLDKLRKNAPPPA